MIKPEKLYRGDKIAIVSLSWGGVCKIRVFLMTAALAANVCGVGRCINWSFLEGAEIMLGLHEMGNTYGAGGL